MRSQLALLLVIFGNAFASCPSNSIASKSRSKCFTFVRSAKSFYEAEMYCMTLGGHLASVENAFEAQQLLQMTIQVGSDKFWIGASNPRIYKDPSKYVWMDRTPFTYTRWHADEPNIGNACVVTVIRNGKWATAPCADQLPFVCISDEKHFTASSLPPLVTSTPTTMLTSTAHTTVKVSTTTLKPTVPSTQKVASTTTGISTPVFTSTSAVTSSTVTITPSVTPPTVTSTPTVTNTPSTTSTPTFMSTPVVTSTRTATSTPTTTLTPTPTITPTPTVTSTSAVTITGTVTSTPTTTLTPTVTSTTTSTIKSTLKPTSTITSSTTVTVVTSLPTIGITTTINSSPSTSPSTTTAVKSTTTPQLPCAEDFLYFQETNSCYKVITTRSTQAAAEQLCQQIHGHLVSIDSKSENDFVNKISGTGQKQSAKDQVWIGLQRSTKNTTLFEWIDGTEGGYRNWADKEPNNKGGNENCVLTYADETGLKIGQWNDAECDEMVRAAVCKIPARQSGFQ